MQIIFYATEAIWNHVACLSTIFAETTMILPKIYTSQTSRAAAHLNSLLLQFIEGFRQRRIYVGLNDHRVCQKPDTIQLNGPLRTMT